jgi:hypothetical protein
LLGVALKVVGGIPGLLFVGRAHRLEELVIAVEPSEGVGAAVVRGEAQLMGGRGAAR